jgi:3-hydroxybutyryl-CoA dehydrogenase
MTTDKLIVAVLGAGTMGHGIAQLTAAHGHPTRLFDVKRELAEAGLGKVRGALDRVVQKGKMPEAERDALLARIKPCDQIAEAVAGAGLVIEAARSRWT